MMRSRAGTDVLWAVSQVETLEKLFNLMFGLFQVTVGQGFMGNHGAGHDGNPP
jgi:hypothetical protein